MRDILLNLLSKKIIASRVIRPVLKLHNATYKLATIFGCSLNEHHPKHEIIQYKQWFVNHINSNEVVLDVGCNNGSMPEVMSEKAGFVYGIEIEKKHIENAKSVRQRSNIEYICADATTYDYSKCKPIDVVTLSNVLEHIEHRVDFLKKLIDKIVWRSEDNKRLLIRVPMIDREWIVLYKKEVGVEYRLDNTHFIEYTFEKFRDELKEGGVDILSYHIKFGEIYAVCKAYR